MATLDARPPMEDSSSSGVCVCVCVCESTRNTCSFRLFSEVVLLY